MLVDPVPLLRKEEERVEQDAESSLCHDPTVTRGSWPRRRARVAGQLSRAGGTHGDHQPTGTRRRAGSRRFTWSPGYTGGSPKSGIESSSPPLTADSCATIPGTV